MNIYFHSNACGVCHAYGRDINFKRCSNCKMIGYCSREHQRKHWPQHKDICKVLGNRMKKYGSIFPPKREEEIIDNLSWYIEKQKLLNIVQSQLDQPFQFSEAQMLLFPRSCEVCHESRPQELVDCPNCPSASFCKKHTNAPHQEKCKLAILSHQLERGPYCANFRNFSVLNIGTKIPEDIEGIANCYRKHYDEKKNVMPVDLWTIMNVEHLWRPYTLLYCIPKFSMSRFPSNIHILGSDISETLTVDGWEVLLHHVNLSEDVVITFIGPELKDCANSAQFGNNQRCKNKKILVNTVGKLYHDYVNCNTYTKPDLIVGFNPGIHVSNIYNWAPTIKEIEKLKCPFLVTAFVEVEMQADQRTIESVLHKNVQPFYYGKNPYRGLIPLRDTITEDFDSYSGFDIMLYESL